MTSPEVVQISTLDLAGATLNLAGATLNLAGAAVDPPAWTDRVAPAALRVLSADEWTRAMRFRIPDRRTEFALTRGTLRLLLGQAIGRPPQELVFAAGTHGKPYLPERPDLHFNVSHTTGRAVIAITRAGPVGVDVERMDDRLNWEAIADQVFSVRARRAIAAAPTDRRSRVFLRCWVRGEAVLKATGEGLTGVEGSTGVDRGLDIPVGDRVAGHPGLVGRGLSLQDLPSDGKYVAAVAVRCAAADTPLALVDIPIDILDRRH